MNDPKLSTQSAARLDADGAPASAGALLRQRREAAGVDPVMLASTLKVTPQKIQALEEDRYNDLPNLPFARSLASTICRALDTDPAPVLALMPQSKPEMPIAAHAHGARSDFDSGAPRMGVPAWLIVVVVLLLAGALAMKFWPEHPFDNSATPPQAASSEMERAAQLASAAASAAASDTASSMAAESASSSASAPAVSASATASAQVPAPASSQAATAADTGTVATAANDASAPQDAQSGSTEQNAISFSAVGPVWISVRDGSGKTLLSRTLSEAEQTDISGEPPFTVVIGNKDNVNVTVRGELLNLDKYARHGSTIARFTVGTAADTP